MAKNFAGWSLNFARVALMWKGGAIDHVRERVNGLGQFPEWGGRGVL